MSKNLPHLFGPLVIGEEEYAKQQVENANGDYGPMVVGEGHTVISESVAGGAEIGAPTKGKKTAVVTTVPSGT